MGSAAGPSFPRLNPRAFLGGFLAIQVSDTTLVSCQTPVARRVGSAFDYSARFRVAGLAGRSFACT